MNTYTDQADSILHAVKQALSLEEAQLRARLRLVRELSDTLSSQHVQSRVNLQVYNLALDNSRAAVNLLLSMPHPAMTTRQGLALTENLTALLTSKPFTRKE